MNKPIDFAIKVGMVIILVVAAITKHQYSYYIFVRWAVSASCVYLVRKYYIVQQSGYVILFSTLALLFNPFKFVWLQRTTWQLIDYVVSAIILFTIFSDLSKDKIN